jgi:hypothetical protein
MMCYYYYYYYYYYCYYYCYATKEGSSESIT